jgi:hypothetical protein
MPGDSGDLAVTMLVWFIFSHARLRVQRAPGIPHALTFQGERFMHNSGASRRGIAESYPSTVITREGG